MIAKKISLQFGHEKQIFRSLLFVFFISSSLIALMVLSSSQSSQLSTDLNDSLIQNCHSCPNKEFEKLMIMQLSEEMYNNQAKEIQNILRDLGISEPEIDYEETVGLEDGHIDVIEVKGSTQEISTPGGDRDYINFRIFPNESSLALFIEKGAPYTYFGDFLVGYFKVENFTLSTGLKAIGAAQRWASYNEAEIQGVIYPKGTASVRFFCGNLVVYVSHERALLYPWEHYPGEWDRDQEAAGNESLKLAKELAEKIALAIQDKKLCQPKSNVILKASAIGYASAKRELEDTKDLKEIEMSGRVFDNTGRPIQGAKIEITAGANETSAVAKEDGSFSLVAAKSKGQGSQIRDNIDFQLRPLQYIVGFADNTPQVIELIKKNNGTVVDQVEYEKGPRALLVTLTNEKDEATFISNLRRSPLVKYVEPNELVYASYVPNDPGGPLQWGPRNIRAGGLPNPSAWNIETGERNISIAIVDTGIQYNHTDLAKFKDGKDKYKYGHDWVDLDDDPAPLFVMEDHGTHCAGIATAVMDNGIGIAGIAPDCSLIAERVMFMRLMPFNETHDIWRGVGYEWDISRGIMDAADQGANIISMSLGSNNSSELEKDATLYASNLGSVLVAASGNDADKSWYHGGIKYPAAYPWVIAVGAADRDNQRADFSQWGPELDLVAPGANIYSTVPFNDYDNMSGTSQATPLVAGVAALVKSRAERWPSESYATNPRYHLNNDQIVKVLIESAVDLGQPGWDQEYGYGKVDAARALRCVNISGTVLEAVLNAPVAGVEVRATSIQGPPGVYSTNENSSLARINSDGSYFLRVPPGIYQICAMAFGYMPSCGLNGDRAELPAFDINGNLYRDNRDFRLVPFPCNVTNRVNDSSTGQPVAAAKIYVDGPPSPYPPHPNIHYETETNSRGIYYFLLEYGVDTNGLYNVTAIKEGYQNQMQSFELNWSNVVTNYYTCRNCELETEDFNPISVNLSLNPGRAEPRAASLSVSGIKFNDSNGNGIHERGEEGLQGWLIRLENGKGNLLQNQTTAVDGSYQFLGLSPGIYIVNEANQSGWTQTVPEEGHFLINLSSRSEEGKDFGNKRQASPAPEPLEIKPGRLDRYLGVLKSDSYAYRQEAIKSLQESDGPQAADNLVQALRYKNSTVRANAAQALGDINDTRSVDPLIESLQDADSNVRVEAARALRKMKDKRAVEPLIKAFKNRQSGIRWDALDALEWISDPRAVDPLIQALQDDTESDNIRVKAAQALGEINDTRAVDPLLQALGYEDFEIRAIAAQSLGDLGDPKAVEPLIQALEDRDSEVRDRAAYALGRIGDRRAVDPLIRALEDKDGDVRSTAAMALGQLGDARALDPLRQALKDRDSLVKRDAAWALEKLSSPVGMETAQVSESVGENHPPTISRLYPVSDNIMLIIGEPITFRIEAEDEDANLKKIKWIFEEAWGFGSGGYVVHGPSCEKSFRLAYDSPGNFSFVAQAIDEQGDVAQASWNVTVT
jgi:HEAT repeat protein/subtilisin family serine protease